MMAQKGA
jgi:predicted nuclease with TOPRIM domain